MTTKQRKFALAAHIDPGSLVAQGLTCRYCPDAAELDVLTACLQAGAQRGLFATLDARDTTPTGEGADAERFGTHGRSRWTAEVEGFNLHAGVTIAADDRAGRERL